MWTKSGELRLIEVVVSDPAVENLKPADMVGCL